MDPTLGVLMREKGSGAVHKLSITVALRVQLKTSTFPVVEVVQGRPKRSFASVILKFCSQVQYPPGLHP